MDLAAFVEIKIDNRSAAQIAHMRSLQVFFAMHAGQRCNFILDKFNIALLVEAPIRRADIQDSLIALHIYFDFNTGFGVEI
jgi:hypothetical protein